MIDSTPPLAWTSGSGRGFGSLVGLRLGTVASRLGVCVIADASDRCQGPCPWQLLGRAHTTRY